PDPLDPRNRRRGRGEMTRSCRGWPTLPGPKSLVALGLLLALSTPSARAGCSHYAVQRSASGAVASATFDHIELISGVTEADATGIPAPDRRAPCPGGLCSGESSIPVLPDPPAPPPFEQWGDASGQPGHFPGPSVTFQAAPAPFRPSH